MPILTETARAKVNLTLEVIGKRGDGYHELRSLVAFADVSDALTLDTAAAEAVYVTGPFGPSLAGENLIAVTLLKAREAEPFLSTGAITLEKRLPIAAGIGGGSADAAAALRLLRRANPGRAERIDWTRLAKSIGADVPVCYENRAAWMTGIGDKLTPSPDFPSLPAVLVNPMVPVPPDKTAQVFRRLEAPPVPIGEHGAVPPVRFKTRAEIFEFVASHRNDLLPAACTIVPAINDVMAALRGSKRIVSALLSGGGPTCIGLYLTGEAATSAASDLARAQPSWWVEPTTLS